MKTVSALLASVTLAAGLAASFSASAQDTIKIGEINSYSGLPSFTEPYRKGWQLALEQINATGGVNGKTLEVISKDDGGKPADAVTAANELVSSDVVVMLCGTFFSNIGLAVSDFAKQKKIYVLRTGPDGKQERLKFNYKEVIKGKNMAQNIQMMPHDTLVIP